MKQKKKIFLINKGCLRRELDASKLADYFKLNECSISKNPNNADFIIFVTCAFKKEMEDNCFDILKKLNKYKGEVIVLGCLPGISPSRLKKEFKGKSLVTKNLMKLITFFLNLKLNFKK